MNETLPVCDCRDPWAEHPSGFLWKGTGPEHYVEQVDTDDPEE